MPELVEVEIVREQLDKKLFNKRIASIDVRSPQLIKAPNDEQTFVDRLTNGLFHSVHRKGKYLIFSVLHDDDSKEQTYLLAHLMMTGAFFYGKDTGVIPMEYVNHIHVTFNFTDGSKLFFGDIRKFGMLRALTHEELEEQEVNKYGPDANKYNISTQVIRNIRETREVKGQDVSIHGKRTIKSVLMDQNIIAGIGNIYASEALFMGEVNPLTKIEDLTDEQIRDIIGGCRARMELSLSMGGTSFSDYVHPDGTKGSFQEALMVYGREGQECYAGCGDTVKKIKIDGRSTFYCPTCQK